MGQPVTSPFPPGTTERTIWRARDGRVLPSAKGAVAGEVEVTYPDGRTEHTLFTTTGQPAR